MPGVLLLNKRWLRWLLLHLVVVTGGDGFWMMGSQTRRSSRRLPASARPSQSSSLGLLVQSAIPSRKTAQNDETRIKILSERLVNLLVTKRQTRSSGSSSSSSTSTTTTSSNEDHNQIKQLVDELVAAQVVFDPVECLDGNSLFVSTVIEGPTPLWETMGAKFFDNVQGQKYTYTPENKSVVNYAEVCGPGTCPQASFGVCAKVIILWPLM